MAASDAPQRAFCSGVTGRNSHILSRRAENSARKPSMSNAAPYESHSFANAASTSA